MEIKDMKIDDMSPASWYMYGREALELLPRFMDDDECMYDHNDFCQSHYRSGKPCPHERARELLEEFSRDLSTMANIKKELAQANSLFKKRRFVKMADTKIKFDLDTEKVIRKLRVLSRGFVNIGETFDEMANMLNDIDDDDRENGETAK